LLQQSQRQRLIRTRQAQGGSQSAKVSRRNEGMERSKSQTKSFQCRGPSSLVEPPYRDIWEIGIKMGRATRGHGKAEARGISPLGPQRQNIGAFVECGIFVVSKFKQVV
jgi:hypothetical protein